MAVGTGLVGAVLAVGALGAGGCIGSKTTPCGSRICPTGSRCATVSGARVCLLPWQLTYCADNGIVDGASCDRVDA